MRRWPALVLVALVLAGCSTDLGSAPEVTPTVTPAPLPATDTPAVGDGVPGLADGLIADPLALATADAGALDGRSYTLDSTWTVRYANGSLRAYIDLHTHVDGPAFLARVTVDGPDAGILANRRTAAVFWSDGREVVERVERDNRISYLHVLPAEYDSSGGFFNSLKRPTPWRDTYGLLASVDLRVVGEERRGDTTVYLLEGTRLADAELFAATTNAERPRDVTLHATVDERGFVRSTRLTYTAEVGGETVHVTRVVRYRDVGETTVPKPGWYATAKNESVRDVAVDG